jgi:hypothetical protein
MRWPVLLALVLVSACTPITRTYGASSPGGMPPELPAQTQVPLWDHFCAELGVRGADDLARLLESASAQGWEMAGASSGIFCFKRPHVAIAPAAASDGSRVPRRFSCEVVGTLGRDQDEVGLPGAPERLLYPE